MIISRRKLMKTAALGAGAVAMPAILKAKDALASSGSVNVFTWGDYIQQNQIDHFEKKTGIKSTSRLMARMTKPSRS